MSRQVLNFWAFASLAVAAATGCQPQQPFYFMEDGDLSHYFDAATEIDYPDVEPDRLDEVENVRAPLTLENAEDFDMWDLTLEEAVRTALSNGQVLRTLGGRFASNGFLQQTQAGEAPTTLLQTPQQASTTFDPAITDTGPLTGTESALAAFDAQWTTSVFWEKNHRPQNVRTSFDVDQIFTPFFQQDLGRFTSEISKFSRSGSIFAFRNNTVYDQNNNPSRALPSDWNVNFEAEVRQPLLQGAGAQYNGIAGPYSPFTGQGTQIFDGVVLARINTDITLAQFEGKVRDLVNEVETMYWELHFGYRNLETLKVGRDSARLAWKRINALKEVGGKGGEADKEAQARSQYFFFRSQVEAALTDLYRVENRLRYLMGLTMSDGRLIRPSDEPTTARLTFDWVSIHGESLVRSVELRAQKWRIKQRELEVIAAKNHLLPRLDAVGRYRWLGMGDDLIGSGGKGLTPTTPGSEAFDILTDGEFQEWQLGLQMNMPLGFRRELSQVRHYQLNLARERALLTEQELELSHQLGDAVRNLVNHYNQTITNFNRRVAAEDEVEATQSAYEEGTTTLDLLLDAQRRRADAEIAYYRSLLDYNRAIIQVHYRKGSLLEYNNVYLAEGPWPKKAYFDAVRRARKRDASTYLDYGYTRPSVFSRGPVLQNSQNGEIIEDMGAGEAQFQDQPFQGELPSPELAPEQPARPTKPNSIFPGPTAAVGPALNSPSGARPVGGSEPAAWNRAETARPIRSVGSMPAAGSRQPKVLQLSYEDFAENNKKHETVANKPARPAASNAPGWKRAQR